MAEGEAGAGAGAGAAAPAAAAPAAAAGDGAGAGGGGMLSVLSGVMRMLSVAMLLRMLLGSMLPALQGGQQQQQQVQPLVGQQQQMGDLGATVDADGFPITDMQAAGASQEIVRLDGTAGAMPVFPVRDAAGRALPPHQCLFREGHKVELRVFLSEEDDFDLRRDADKEIWAQQDLFFDARESNNREMAMNITVDDRLAHNGSLFAHVFLARKGANIDDLHPDYDDTRVAYRVVQLNRFRELNGSIVSHWVPQLNVAIVPDMPRAFARNSVPPQIASHIQFHVSGNFFPVLYNNDFWILSTEHIPLNETLLYTTLPLNVSFAPISFWVWMLQTQMEAQWEAQEQMGMSSPRQTDMFREMLMDTHPVLLGVTVVVSILHMVFDFLAFKNDVSFWKTRKSLRGLSLQGVVISCFFHTVITLYLFDNRDDTNWMILASSAVGLLIEYWKLTRVAKIWFEWNRKPPARSTEPDSASQNVVTTTGDGASEAGKKGEGTFDFWGVAPVRLCWRFAASYTSNTTMQYDQQATSHLLYVIAPMIVGYSAYSFLYREHKSTYSWVISSLTGFVYAFGFIMMTPQLFINYKLKSVAHMPWKAMVYKALNTFIDDLFAFIIRMPTMHRLACFRDDLVFLIYVYQRWAYPVDASRINEYGQVAEDAPEEVKRRARAGADASAETAATTAAGAAAEPLDDTQSSSGNSGEAAARTDSSPSMNMNEID